MPVNKTTYCDVFAFLWLSLQSMACFFDCFRVRNAPRNPPSPPNDEASEKIRLSSLFSAEERGECATIMKDRESLVRRLGQSEINEELLEEAKLLKACGTLPQTPAEIRKAVTFAEKIEKSDVKSLQSVLISSLDSPVADQQSEVLPQKLERSHAGTSHSALESSPETPKELQKEETLAGITEKSDVREPHTLVKASPYPTPRKITDDMQTPGTVFATNMKSLTKGNARIRSEYVYGVLNPVENFNQLEELKEEPAILHGSLDHGENLLQQEEDVTPSPDVQSGRNAAKEEAVRDASLSSWLKPPSADDDGDCNNLRSASCRKPNFGRTPGDRPIIGLVATHWNEPEDTSHISPKWWDGNGIPNSTTKYKEDQKVCWHATPFEERLEKALSEETCVPQRKSIDGTPIIFEELEGTDTASSQLQSVNQKSVVSF